MAKTRRQSIELISNSGPNTIPAFLRQAMTAEAYLDIAVAFLSEKGLDEFDYLLTKARQTRVLTGLYQSVTEPKALRLLLRRQQGSNGRVVVRLAKQEHFHWKAYFLQGRTRGTAIVGSSNLTRSGLKEEGELNVVLSMPNAGAAFKRLHSAFRTLWDRGSVPLTAEHIRRYERLRGRAGGKPRFHTVSLSKVLGASKAPAPKAETPACKHWCIGLYGWFSKAASAAIEECTNWDSRGWECFNTGRAQIGEGDKVIFVSRPDKCVVAAEITRTTRLPVNTPDGRRFAAFKDLKGYRRKRLSDNMSGKLKLAGLVARKRERVDMKRISEARFHAAVETLW